MKVKFFAILIIASLFFVGCVSTKNVPVADSDIDELRNHTIAVPKRGVPDFAAFTADKAAFGLIGAAAMISEGNKIIRENAVEDPANYISEQLVSALSDKYQMTPIDTSTSELESEDVKNISRVFKDADYVLDVRTINWQFAYFPSDWNNYRVIYSSKLRLIDTKKSITIAEGFCPRVPEKDEHAPSYDELLSNNAERLKGELKISADYCIDLYKKNILGLKTHIQTAGKIDNPQANKGDFVSSQKSTDPFNTSDASLSELEVEKMRIANEEAQIERLRQELAQLTAENGQGQKTEPAKLASIPKEVQVAEVSLRKKPKILSRRDLKNMLLKYHFFDGERNPSGNFSNDFIANPDGTITDRVTGLMWQKSGSANGMIWLQATRYIQKLNRERFAGYTDWRMPTIEELASLMMRTRQQGLYLSPLFDRTQKKCWSADSLSRPSTYYEDWIISFSNGFITDAKHLKKIASNWYAKDEFNFVRAVRSVK